MTKYIWLKLTASMVVGAMIATLVWSPPSHIVGAFIFNLAYAMYITIFFAIPGLLILKHYDRIKLFYIVGTAAFVAFTGYFVADIFAAHFAAELNVDGVVIVHDGEFTKEGILFYINDGMKVGLIGAACGFVFWILGYFKKLEVKLK